MLPVSQGYQYTVHSALLPMNKIDKIRVMEVTSGVNEAQWNILTSLSHKTKLGTEGESQEGGLGGCWPLVQLWWLSGAPTTTTCRPRSPRPRAHLGRAIKGTQIVYIVYVSLYQGYRETHVRDCLSACLYVCLAVCLYVDNGDNTLPPPTYTHTHTHTHTHTRANKCAVAL